MLFFINFKAYRESTGNNATALIRKIEANFSANSSIIVVTNPLDSMIETSLKKYIQSAEPVEAGPFTGHIPIHLLKNYGYSGIMLNHSEFRLDRDQIRMSVAIGKKIGLNSLVCAANLKEVEETIEMHPDLIAYEPPELIGGNVSVSTEKPEIIRDAANFLHGTGIKLIVGAGIKDGNDVRISKQLGAEGILVASGVVKSKDPITVIAEMLKEVG